MECLMSRSSGHESRPLTCFFASRARALPRGLFVCRCRVYALAVSTRTGEASVLVVPSKLRHSALWGDSQLAQTAENEPFLRDHTLKS
jgi:hypothetical protein